MDEGYYGKGYSRMNYQPGDLPYYGASILSEGENELES